MPDGERLRRLIPRAKRRGKKRTRSRFGLRARITAGFAFGALVLAVLITSITYLTTRSSIVGQDERSFEAQAITNASTVRPGIFARQPTIAVGNAIAVLDELHSSTSFSLVYIAGAVDEWFSSSPTSFTYKDLPPSLLETTFTGVSSEQVFPFNGAPTFGVGIALPGGSRYFAAFNMSQSSDNLRALLASLIAASIVTTVLAALLGRWVAGRALRPLRDVSQAALAIASGMFDTRLRGEDDRDLAVLTSSFNRMADRLQQRIERDARFTSDVSHELRSPLTTLATALSVIEARRDDLPERAQSALDLLATEVRRFQRMVRDLLEISRYDSRSADFEPTPVEVGDLIRHAVAPAGHAPIPLEVDPSVDHQMVLVDKRRMERVFGNLIENADRYAGGPTGVVVSASDAFVRVAVDDAGPGIPDKDRDRIFERFARGSADVGARGKGAGTGLGLALVHEHVRLHGGRAFVTDSPAGGARFVVELPIAPRTVIEDGADDDGAVASDDDVLEVRAP